MQHCLEKKHVNFTRKKAETIGNVAVFIQRLQIEQSITLRSTLDTGCQYTYTSIRHIYHIFLRTYLYRHYMH